MRRRDFLAKTVSAMAVGAGIASVAESVGWARAARLLSGVEGQVKASDPQPAVVLPRILDIRNIKAWGPLDAILRKSYRRQLEGPFGSDWNDKDCPGDGRGRWIQALCNLGAYLHVKPEQMMPEVRRMRTMRNANGFFGSANPPELIQAQASFDNAWVIHWGLDYTAFFDDPLGVTVGREIADSFYVPRTKFVAPYEGAGSRWVGEAGHNGVGFGGIAAMARLAIATGHRPYIDFTRALADVFLSTDYRRSHGHCVSTALIGLVYAYEATRDRRYLVGAIRGAEVLRRAEQADMAFMVFLKDSPYTEGCGVSDWFYLNLLLGRATGNAAYFDKAECILWGPLLHHIRPNGGMGIDHVPPHESVLSPDIVEAAGCCTMWAPNGLVRALSHAVMADPNGLTVPLFYPFSAVTKGPASGTVGLTMATSYPENGQVRITLDQCRSRKPWRLKLRVPSWSPVLTAKVNGSDFNIESKHGWLEITRLWKTGDEVAMDIPMNLWMAHTSSDQPLTIPEGSDRAVLEDVRAFRGPLLLGVDQLRNPDVKWTPGAHLVIFLPARGQTFDALPSSPSVQEMDLTLSYPKAHGKVQATLKSMNANRKQLSKPSTDVVLTPIAEYPGKLSSDHSKDVILFDVVVQRGGQG